jgi:hypothetical protein
VSDRGNEASKMRMPWPTRLCRAIETALFIFAIKNCYPASNVFGRFYLTAIGSIVLMPEAGNFYGMTPPHIS